MMTNLTNQLTISQETDKDAISYGVSMAVNDFFTLTERRKEKEERERITEALIKIVKKQFGDLTLEDVREGIENGCSEAYGEISNFDEAIRLIPRFLRAYRKELQNKSTSTKTTVSQQEQQKDLIKKGETVFMDHILLFTQSKACFFQFKESKIGPEFCRKSFDAFVNHMTSNEEYLNYFFQTFKQDEHIGFCQRRVEQEYKILYPYFEFDIKKVEHSIQYLMNVISIYFFMKDNQGVEFKGINQ